MLELLEFLEIRNPHTKKINFSAVLNVCESPTLCGTPLWGPAPEPGPAPGSAPDPAPDPTPARPPARPRPGPGKSTPWPGRTFTHPSFKTDSPEIEGPRFTISLMSTALARAGVTLALLFSTINTIKTTLSLFQILHGLRRFMLVLDQNLGPGTTVVYGPFPPGFPGRPGVTPRTLPSRASPSVRPSVRPSGQ